MSVAVAELDADTRILAKIVGHPIRSKIIALLGERGPLSWKELSTELGVKTGALYHHLDTLEGLVERDASKKYVLTKTGRIVYSSLSESHTIDAVQKAVLEIKSEGSTTRTLASIFVPRSLLDSLASSRSLAVLFLVFFSVSFSVLSAWSHTSPHLYFIKSDPGFIQIFGDYFVSLGGLVAICLVADMAFYKTNLDVVSLATVSAFSFVPAFAASIFALLPPIENFLAMSSIVYTLYLVFFQAWCSTLLGAGLSAVSGIRIERTLFIGLVALYATMVLMLIQGVGP
jgi:DNA-binding transcriptional ArsR family regulator